MYVYTESAASHPESAAIVKDCEGMRVPGILLSEAKFRAISSVDHGVGVMFVAGVPKPAAPETLTRSALLLESIQDPGNMGTMLRTAAAAGVTEVYVSRGSVAVWSPKVLRAGMGAHYSLRVYEECDLAALITGSKVPVLVTSLNATDSIYDKNLSGETAWLFGNEGNGVSHELLDLAVEHVIIPQNPRVESLNVAAAVAVCLFERVRQRGDS